MISPFDIIAKKNKEKIVMLTCYTYTEALLFREIDDIDIILVGDSGGMLVFGHPTTIPTSVEEMELLVRAVSRGIKNKFMLVADMPFGSYQVGVSEAVRSAIRFVKAGANAVKIEGGMEYEDIIKAILRAGIPVMGHIGLMPQSINLYGGYKVQGRDERSRKSIMESAKRLEDFGVFSIVLEGVPESLAKEITENIGIPTIGIGAGKHCDGQVLVHYDLLGFYDKVPKFVRKYKNFRKEFIEAVESFINDVRDGKFPSDKETYK